MSKIYEVTISGLPPDVWEMIVVFSDSIANSNAEPVLEDLAKAVSKEAIIKRWHKLSPENRGEPDFIRSFSVEVLPHSDVESVAGSGIGPYHAQIGVDVWMTNGPFSFGAFAPPEIHRGGLGKFVLGSSAIALTAPKKGNSRASGHPHQSHSPINPKEQPEIVIIKSILLTIALLGFIASVYAARPSPKAPSHHHRTHHKKSGVPRASPSPSATPKAILKKLLRA
jgi:hypothetical protein